jgi:voltage-dependent calcium channel alpha-2/delta-4
MILHSNQLQRYKSFNARVQKKNGTELIKDIVESIGRMLNRKTNAVNCIAKRAEEYAKEFHERNMLNVSDEYNSFNYPSSKFSLVKFERFWRQIGIF